MHLNDLLIVSPTIFDDGWEEQPSPPLPPSLQDKCGKERRAFFHRDTQIGVNISLEDKAAPAYVHLSIRKNNQHPVSDDEAFQLVDLFFPGCIMAQTKEEFEAGLWCERRGVGFMGMKVRHFSKLAKL